MKSSPFGSKVADAVPTGVPKNWSNDVLEDAIVDYRTSIASRKSEMAAFDEQGIGSATQRLAHARRIGQEEAFLQSMEHQLENRR